MKAACVICGVIEADARAVGMRYLSVGRAPGRIYHAACLAEKLPGMVRKSVPIIRADGRAAWAARGQ